MHPGHNIFSPLKSGSDPRRLTTLLLFDVEYYTPLGGFDLAMRKALAEEAERIITTHFRPPWSPKCFIPSEQFLTPSLPLVMTRGHILFQVEAGASSVRE